MNELFDVSYRKAGVSKRWAGAECCGKDAKGALSRLQETHGNVGL